MCVPDLNGYIVHFDKVVLGEIELTIYNPVINPYTDVIFDNPIESFLIKDIKIESQRINLSKNKDNEKKDTIYSNVVNESYINQCDDIKFKITSKNDSELSYSKVIYNNALLDIIQNKITNENEKLEKILINRIVNQYKQPKLKLNQIVEPNILPYSIVTDNYLSGKKFIFTGGNIDYENNSMECNLIEIN